MPTLFLIGLLLLVALPFAAMAQDTKPAAAPEARAFTGEYKQQETLPGKDSAKKRAPHVEIWLPPDFRKSEAKRPLLMYSHAFGGCSREATFLTSSLADEGYIVIAPDHADGSCAGPQSADVFGSGLVARTNGVNRWPERSFRTPDAWTDATESDRKDDVLFALSSMLDDPQYKDYIDTGRIGLIGYDLGGYTMLGIAGAWPSWKDRRFKAVIALSPYIEPFQGRNLRGIDIPVLYEGGTADMLHTPQLRRQGGAYDHTPAPKYYIEIEKADHAAWTDSGRRDQDVIRRGILAFVNRYVKGDESIVVDETKKSKIATFKKDEGSASKKK